MIIDEWLRKSGKVGWFGNVRCLLDISFKKKMPNYKGVLHQTMTIIPFSQTNPASFIWLSLPYPNLFPLSYPLPPLPSFLHPKVNLHNNRRMTSPPSSKDILSKLVCRISIPTPSSHPSHTKQTHFSKYDHRYLPPHAVSILTIHVPSDPHNLTLS